MSAEVAQVGGHVEGEAVRGDAASDMNADCGDFAARGGTVPLHGSMRSAPLR